MEVQKDDYSCLTVIIYAVLSAWHYKNTKGLGMPAVTDHLLMTWYYLLPVILQISIFKVVDTEKHQMLYWQTQSLFSVAEGKVQLLSGESKQFDSAPTSSS